jgi:hypothetical protein
MKSAIETALKMVFILGTSLIMFGCGGSSSSDVNPKYSLELVSGATATEGKSDFKIRVTNRSSGATVAGKNVSLTPKMNMVSSSSHGTPVGTITDNADGTYSGNIYYLMASGATMGTWDLKFSVDGETVIFNPSVAMAMGTTPRSTLKGVNDMIGSMTGSASARSYYLFNDGISGSTVKLYIAAADDSMMTMFPAISVNSTLHNQSNAAVLVTAMSVEVSTDKTNWTALNDDGTGHWSKTGLAMLSTGMHLFVRLTVNGEQKTTDGSAVAIGNTNAYGDFTLSGM